MTQQVAQPVEQPVEELEGEEPFQPFQGIEEQDLSPVRAAGSGPIGTQELQAEFGCVHQHWVQEHPLKSCY